MSVRTWMRVLGICVVFCVAAACGDDEKSSGDKKGGDGQGVRITHQGETLVADRTVYTVNTFWFKDDSEFRTTVMGGWIDVETTKFGVVTVRVALRGVEGQPMGPGVYTLTSNEMLRSGPMTAHLSLSGVEMERLEDIGGIVNRIVAYEGTLELKAIDGADGQKLERLEFDFDGNFGNPDLPEEPTEDDLLSFSGQVRLKKK